MLDYDRARVLYILWGANPGILEKAKDSVLGRHQEHWHPFSSCYICSPYSSKWTYMYYMYTTQPLALAHGGIRSGNATMAQEVQE